MSTIRMRSEPFSSVDAAWLHMDEPTNLAMVTGVITFDRPLDFEWLKATIVHRLLPFRRFRQRVKESRLGLRRPRWEIDPHFDLDAHLERMTLPAPGDRATLQQLAGIVMSTPLDPDRPLWHFYLVENYGEGCAIIARLHHCIADGLALVQVLLSMTDKEPDAPWPEPAPQDADETSWNPLAEMLEPARVAVNRSLNLAGSLWRAGVETLIDPSRAFDAAMMGASGTLALSKLLLIGPDRQTLFRGTCGVDKRAAWSTPIPLADVKAVAGAMDGTINDVLLAAVTGALRRYLEDHDQPVKGLNIRAVVPVNLRGPGELDPDKLGNRFGLVFLSLPVGVRDPIKRIVVLKRRMDEIKDTPEAIVAFGILGTIGMTPIQIENIIVRIFGSKATAVMTNVPGPHEVLYLAGQPIRGIMFWVPQPGRLGMGVSIISYAGEAVVGLATDAGLVPDPDAIIAAFHDEFESIQEQVGAVSSSRKASEAAPKHEPPAARGHPGQCQALTQSGRRCKNRAMPGSTTCRLHQGSAV